MNQPVTTAAAVDPAPSPPNKSTTKQTTPTNVNNNSAVKTKKK